MVVLVPSSIDSRVQSESEGSQSLSRNRLFIVSSTTGVRRLDPSESNLATRYHGRYVPWCYVTVGRKRVLIWTFVLALGIVSVGILFLATVYLLTDSSDLAFWRSAPNTGEIQARAAEQSHASTRLERAARWPLKVGEYTVYALGLGAVLMHFPVRRPVADKPRTASPPIKHDK